MALTDRRPIELPVVSSSASPAFNPASASLDGLDSSAVMEDLDSAPDMDLEDQDDQEEEDDRDDVNSVELSPTSRSISPDSLMNLEKSVNGSDTSRGSTPPNSSSASQSMKISTGTNHDGKEGKKAKSNPRVPIATGISTTIPVTGEKPRPSQKDDPSLEDDVLYAIFLILYEKDGEGKGMTVKQICDILIDRHPEMANLSTKTSNLVSAKLNAYVKRVEKGDPSLKYALSRDWADASPKRMVYVYRGLLTADFHVHVKSMMEAQKKQERKDPGQSTGPYGGSSKSQSSSKLPLTQSANFHLDINEDALEAGKQANFKPRRSTMFDLGITRNSFLSNSIDKSNLFVPYSSAPVTASLKDKVTTEALNSNMSNMTLNGKEASGQDHNEDDQAPEDQMNDRHFKDFEEFEVFDGSEDIIETFKKNGKRSKSMSYLTSKKHKILTAAAAAPRAPKIAGNHSPSPHAVAAAAALHAAAIKAINYDPLSSDLLKSQHCNKKWLDVIRSGFLSQDISTPEDISLSDLDKYF